MRIAVCGAHGVGKSTLVKRLAKELDYQIIPEFAHEISIRGGFKALTDLTPMEYWVFECALAEITHWAHRTHYCYVADRALYDVAAYIHVRSAGHYVMRQKLIHEIIDQADNIGYDRIIFLRFPSSYTWQLSDTSQQLARQVDNFLHNVFKRRNLNILEVPYYNGDSEFSNILEFVKHGRN